MLHLFFADDLVLMCRANLQNTKTIRDTLEQFYIELGQSINLLKSKIILSNNCPIDTQSQITNLLGIKSGRSFGKYLGYPLNKNKWIKNDLSQYWIIYSPNSQVEKPNF